MRKIINRFSEPTATTPATPAATPAPETPSQTPAAAPAQAAPMFSEEMVRNLIFNGIICCYNIIDK